MLFEGKVLHKRTTEVFRIVFPLDTHGSYSLKYPMQEIIAFAVQTRSFALIFKRTNNVFFESAVPLFFLSFDTKNAKPGLMKSATKSRALFTSHMSD